ncbi:MAG: hypothetical protein K2Y30_01930 [Flavobacteriaceae bacterium]|nr:hypothetical protein [Flavobacteriaceae bacterium]
MKQTVIEFFQNLPTEKSEQFNQAFELYRKSPTKNSGVERSLNAQGFSERTLENLLYDLQKMYGITDVEKVKTAKLKVVTDDISDDTLGTSDGFVEGVEGTRPDHSHPGKIIVNDAEVVTDAAVPLREEFPFLNDKECPNELKILVADKITAWKTYEENHSKLLQIESGELVVPGEEQAEIAKAAVTAFAENQAIYDELNAYKETGKVLGVHPIFRTLQMQREVDAMDQAELIAYKGASAKYFSTNKKDLAKAETAKNDAKIEEITARVAVRKEMLALVNKKLGIPSK